MKMTKTSLLCLPGLLAVLSAPASATVAITSIHASVPPPQVIGTSITWTATATDSSPNQLTFQFSVAPPNSSTFSAVRDYNAGTFSAGTWTSTFVWTPTGIEGSYTVKVSIKDFTSGQTTAKSGAYVINPLVTGSTPVVAATANPLVASVQCAFLRGRQFDAGPLPNWGDRDEWQLGKLPSTVHHDVRGRRHVPQHHV